ncbi:MAG: sialidase family protein [Pirellulales bacterium]
MEIDLDILDRRIVIDDVCAWPNLTLMPNGDVVATIWNQPCHGHWEGSSECWASENGGVTWAYRGTPAPHKPTENRHDVGGGPAKNGDLVIMCSGKSDRPKPPADPAAESYTRSLTAGHYRTRTLAYIKARGKDEAHLLPPLLSRSADGGRTWDIREDALPPKREGGELIPHGDLETAADGALCQSVYTETIRPSRTYILRSDDDGYTWSPPTLLAEGFNECDILHLGDGEWLAACRREGGASNHLFRSRDDGHTWAHEEMLAPNGTSAVNLMRLADERVVFTSGDRSVNRRGIDVRVSLDERGQRWSIPHRLKHIDAYTDSGYPSTVQLPDGRLVTAYYAGEDGAYRRYHMGVVLWRIR